MSDARDASANATVGGVIVARVGDVVGALVVGALAGLAAGVFLAGLGQATSIRDEHARLVVPLLPIGAALLLEVVARAGGRASGGTAVVLDAMARSDAPAIPTRLLPIALLGTWWTHFFGGSAGREGSAVQMGAAVADGVASLGQRLFGELSVDARRGLLVAGVAGGFGGVFGTPVAGAIFAMEVVVARRIDTTRALSAVVGAVVGDLVGHAVLGALGGAHGSYPTLPPLAPSTSNLVAFAVLGVAVGLSGRAFMALMALVKRLAAPRSPWQRGVVGGAIVVVIWWVVPGAEPLVGLSVPTLEAAASGDVDAVFPWTFALKLLLTAVTLGIGLIGGEVTPLFVIGATLGVVAAGPLGLPPAHAACAGLAAMFGACAAAPVALLAMIIELCGAGGIVQQLVCIFTASIVVGGESIYRRSPASPTTMLP